MEEQSSGVAQSEQGKPPKYKFTHILRDFATGLIMGIANIIPGVSGGTMAVVTGIYDKVISLFSLDRQFIKREWKFVIVVVAGILVGIFGFSTVIKLLLGNWPIATNAFFVGVVVGTVPFIGRRVKSNRGNLAAKVIPCVLMLGLMAAMVLLRGDVEAAATSVRFATHSFVNALILGGTMVLTSACMVIPGISGSFVALALGVYPSIIEVLSTFDWLMLIPVAIGMLLGLWGGSKLIKLLLGRFPAATYSAILGLLIGSVFVLVWPLVPMLVWSVEILIAVFTLAAGVVVAWLFSKRDD